MDNKLKELAIEILQRCPNRCIYCSSLSDLNKTHIIPFEKICQVVDDAKTLGATRICLSGGEPFLHPRIVDTVKYIAGVGLECYIYSSGVYYSDGCYSSIPVELLNAVKPFATKLIVNYETTDVERYDVIMGTACNGLSLLESSIQSAVAAGMEVEAHFVPMHINWRDAASVVDRCKQLGVNKVSFLRLVMQGRAHENADLTALSDDERRDFISLVKSIPNKDDKAIRLGIPFRGNSFQCACTAGVQKISIRYDGVVHPCESFKNDELAGLINAKPDTIYDKSLIDIYRDSPYLAEVRAIIREFKQMRCSESCVNQYYRNLLDSAQSDKSSPLYPA